MHSRLVLINSHWPFVLLLSQPVTSAPSKSSLTSTTSNSGLRPRWVGFLTRRSRACSAWTCSATWTAPRRFWCCSRGRWGGSGWPSWTLNSSRTWAPSAVAPFSPPSRAPTSKATTWTCWTTSQSPTATCGWRSGSGEASPRRGWCRSAWKLSEGILYGLTKLEILACSLGNLHSSSSCTNLLWTSPKFSQRSNEPWKVPTTLSCRASDRWDLLSVRDSKIR